MNSASAAAGGPAPRRCSCGPGCPTWRWASSQSATSGGGVMTSSAGPAAPPRYRNGGCSNGAPRSSTTAPSPPSAGTSSASSSTIPDPRDRHPGERLPLVLRGRRHSRRRPGHRRHRGPGQRPAARPPGPGHHQPNRLRRAYPAATRHPHRHRPHHRGSTCSATATTTGPPSRPGSAACCPAAFPVRT
jgi:hypothetical protein